MRYLSVLLYSLAFGYTLGMFCTDHPAGLPLMLLSGLGVLRAFEDLIR